MSIQPRAQFIRKAAIELLKNCRINDPPVDLRIITDKLGLLYEEVDYFDEDVDSLIIPVDDRVVAAVNLKQSRVRRRFSLAHEICHFLHHKDRSLLEEPRTIDSPETWDESTAGKDPFEAEADIFAGELLVPLPMLKKAYRPGHTAADLARIFDVSEAVASIAFTNHFNALFKK
jgi:Zn-dependent peptidase ImmA (M78 family)